MLVELAKGVWKNKEHGVVKKMKYETGNNISLYLPTLQSNAMTKIIYLPVLYLPCPRDVFITIPVTEVTGDVWVLAGLVELCEASEPPCSLL